MHSFMPYSGAISNTVNPTSSSLLEKPAVDNILLPVPAALVAAATKTQEAFNHTLPILISGAGIAGLTLANALNELNISLPPSQQISYILVEREKDPATRNQGYGLSLLHNTVTYIKSIHAVPNIDQRTVRLTKGYEGYNSDGQLLSHDLKTNPIDHKKVMARGEIRESMLEKLGKDKVLWDTRVDTFEKTDRGLKIHLVSNGQSLTLEASNLIAADGVNSPLRNQVAKDKKNYLGVVGVYGCIPNAKATEHLDHEFQVDDFKGWRLFSKPYNVENYNWQMFFPWPEQKPLPSHTDMLKYIVDEITQKGWKSTFIDHLKDTDPTTMRSGLLYDRDPLYPLEDAGPITFMGDAAHPVSPYKGRGANLAVEGVQRFIEITKKSLLEEGQINWSKINREYEAQHWPHAAKIQLSCRESVWMHHFDSNATT